MPPKQVTRVKRQRDEDMFLIPEQDEPDMERREAVRQRNIAKSTVDAFEAEAEEEFVDVSAYLTINIPQLLNNEINIAEFVNPRLVNNTLSPNEVVMILNSLYEKSFTGLSKTDTRPFNIYLQEFFTYLLTFISKSPKIEDKDIEAFIRQYETYSSEDEGEVHVADEYASEGSKGKATVKLEDIYGKDLPPDLLNRLRRILHIITSILIYVSDRTQLDELPSLEDTRSSSHQMRRLLHFSRANPSFVSYLSEVSTYVFYSIGDYKGVIVSKLRDPTIFAAASSILTAIVINSDVSILNFSSIIDGVSSVFETAYPYITSSTFVMALAITPIVRYILYRYMKMTHEVALELCLRSYPPEIYTIIERVINRISASYLDITSGLLSLRVKIGQHVVEFATVTVPSFVSSAMEKIGDTVSGAAAAAVDSSMALASSVGAATTGFGVYAWNRLMAISLNDMMFFVKSGSSPPIQVISQPIPNAEEPDDPTASQDVIGDEDGDVAVGYYEEEEKYRRINSELMVSENIENIMNEITSRLSRYNVPSSSSTMSEEERVLREHRDNLDTIYQKIGLTGVKSLTNKELDMVNSLYELYKPTESSSAEAEESATPIEGRKHRHTKRKHKKTNSKRSTRKKHISKHKKSKSKRLTRKIKK